MRIGSGMFTGLLDFNNLACRQHPHPPRPPTLLPPSTTYFEVIGIPKSRLAGSASVGMFSAVLHAVTSQVAQLTECGPALVTLERPLSCVGAAVHGQVGRGGEGCPAHFALKRLFSCETAQVNTII